jgi:hypothetical protein
VQQQVTSSLQLSSSTLNAGAIPDRCGCKGAGSSPQLSWNDPPAGTKSFAFIVDDPDSPVGHLHRHYVVHWLVFDMPPERRELAAALSPQALSDGSVQGTNEGHSIGYMGPCPNGGDVHHYRFTIYALDTRLGLPASARGRELMQALDGHILARGVLIGTYRR